MSQGWLAARLDKARTRVHKHIYEVVSLTAGIDLFGSVVCVLFTDQSECERLNLKGTTTV